MPNPIRRLAILSMIIVLSSCITFPFPNPTDALETTLFSAPSQTSPPTQDIQATNLAQLATKVVQQTTDQSKSTQAAPETRIAGRVTAQPGELPPGAVIVFRRSGGLAGLEEEWTIYADGRVTASDGRQWQASPEGVSSLLEQLTTLGFFDLKASPKPVIPCCDRFYYELFVITGGQAHTAATYDAAPDTPAGLWQAIGLVTEFLEQAGEQTQ